VSVRDTELFGKRFSELLKERGFSHRGFSMYAKRKGKSISAKTIGLWAIGRNVPNEKNLAFLSNELNASVKYLTGESSIRHFESVIDEWNNRVSPSSVKEVKTLETFDSFISLFGVKSSYGEKEVVYSYDGMTVEYSDSEVRSLIDNIKNIALNLIFSYQARNKGESKNDSDEQA